ncbi:MAG TPA: M23 family metallopeptidase [Kiritimatiellia bacterium]|nr:M23 family metallopeptidase [Kiritimatiellia bacterium]
MSRRARKSPLRHLVWILPLLVLDFFLFRWLALRQGGCEPLRPPAPESVAPAGPPPPPPPVWHQMTAPTPQTNLLAPDLPGVLQPTGSGRLESAKFGSTRINSNGSAVFHEGVDIAATARDRKGHATDPVFAVADGRVAFVNSSSGNSSYGKYVVLEHPDPSLGVVEKRDGTSEPAAVYSLYAHLADVRFGIRPGHHVAAGSEIGTLGNTSNTRPPIPHSRSHLHWEIGLMLNARYEIKHREEKLKPDFGNYNGRNLFGIDPLDFFAARQRQPGLTMAAYLAALTPACEVVLRGKAPDFFRRYPALWHGPPRDGNPIHLALSESGMPLAGRNATAVEIALLGNQRQAVAKVNPDVLGRNGRGYVTRSGNQWKFTPAGRQWADHFFY